MSPKLAVEAPDKNLCAFSHSCICLCSGYRLAWNIQEQMADFSSDGKGRGMK